MSHRKKKRFFFADSSHNKNFVVRFKNSFFVANYENSECPIKKLNTVSYGMLSLKRFKYFFLHSRHK